MARVNLSELPLGHLISGYEVVIDKDGEAEVRNVNYGKVLKGGKDNRGYWRYTLKDNEGKFRYIRKHRLMALSFLPNPNNLDSVNHKDGNKLNNNISNLEWISHKDNMQHAHSNGLIKYSNYKLSLADKVKIKSLIDSGMTNRELSEVFGVTDWYIASVRKGEKLQNII